MHALSVPSAAPTASPALPRLGGSDPSGNRIGLTTASLTFNGAPWLPVAGEIHYSRLDRRLWREELLRMKALGVSIASTYVFWNHHEEEEGRFDWTGNRDLRSFIRTCAEAGLYAIVRMGPFCHGEVRNGGIPDWLYGRPFPLRSNDERYLAYVRRLYGRIGLQAEGLLFKDGGPVIGIQLENEYMHAGAPWETIPRKAQEWVPAGSGGVEHMRMLKSIAVEAGMTVPIYTCTAWGGAPVDPEEMLPLYGGYAYCPWNVTEATPVHGPTGEYLFRDFHGPSAAPPPCTPPYDPAAYPFACCEMGGGMQSWYGYRFTVDPRSVEALALMKLAGGCSLLGYYMYHGGTNPVAARGFLNEHVTPRLSYDFQAPLGEYGQERESARRLRRLHLFCRCFGDRLIPMATALPAEAPASPADARTLRYAARAAGDSGFLFLNNYQDHAEMRDHEGVAVELALPGGALRIPRAGGFTLKAGACALMPFGMDVEGARLEYATAQPLARREADGISHWFFFAPDGIPAEYCIAEEGAASVDGAPSRREAGRVIVTPAAGAGRAFRLTARGGGRAVIHTLTEEESLRFALLDLWGAERAVICGADIYADAGSLRIRHAAEADGTVELWVAPAPLTALRAAGAVLAARADGDFTRYGIPVNGCRVEPVVRMAGPGDAEVSLPAEAFTDAHELLLSIGYAGDVGSAFIDGALMSDNFCNGAPWEIGLSGLRPAVMEKGLSIHVTPRREGTVVVHESGMAHQEELKGREVAEIRSITARAVREVTVCAADGNRPL